jgi:hypothetical protein
MESTEAPPVPPADPGPTVAGPAPSARGRLDRVAVLLLVSVAAVLARGYFTRIDLPHLQARIETHHAIVAATAPSPYRYRVLIPFVGDALTAVLAPATGRVAAFVWAYLAIEAVAFALLMLVLYRYLRSWFGASHALIGVLFVAATLPTALADHYYQPWSLLKPALVAAGLLLARAGRHVALAFLVLVATLNRETALYIPLLYLATRIDVAAIVRHRRPPRAATLGWFVLYAGIWLGVMLALRAWRGPAPHAHALAEILAVNLRPENTLRLLINLSLFFGFFWFLVLFGLRRADPFLRRAAATVPLYLALVVLWGRWYEVRLLMPLYPVLVPLGLAYLAPGADRAAAAATPAIAEG